MKETSAFHLFAHGGPIMVPLLICSVFAMKAAITWWLDFCRARHNLALLRLKLFQLLKENNIQEAAGVLQTDASPVAKILKAGVLNFSSSKEEMKSAMQDVSAFEIPKLEKGLPSLATVAYVTPLLGMLGTVTGMITCFQSLQASGKTLHPVTMVDFTAGIWLALVSTLAGLMIAIPVFVAHSYFVNSLNGFVLDIQETINDFATLSARLSESRTAPENGPE